MLTIKCARCRKKVFKYHKIGRGRVLHCWKDRIHKDLSIHQGRRILCTCGNVLGTDMGDRITMKQRAARVITPVTNAQRYVLMAIERGKLQNLIFDNQVLTSHRALAALLGSILKLPPVQRALAGEQIKSRFLAAVDRLDGTS